MERKSVYFVFFVFPKNKVDSMTLLVILSTLLTYPLTYKLYLLPLGGGEGGGAFPFGKDGLGFYPFLIHSSITFGKYAISSS